MFTTINGIKLHYTIEGSGPPIVIVSAGGSPIYQRTFSPSLRQHAQLIFLDLRGGGPSETGAVDEITLETFADDIEGVRLALGHEQVTVLGHSLHGWFALAYAHRYPEHTSGVVVANTPPMADTSAVGQAYWETMASSERKALLTERLASLDEAELAALPPDQAFVRWYVASGPKRFYDPDFDSAFFCEDCSFSIDVFQRVGALLNGYDASPTFASMTCPVFIAQGIFDYPIPPTTWYPAKDAFPNATYHVFERSGHWPFYEEQAMFDRKLVDWLPTR